MWIGGGGEGRARWWLRVDVWHSTRTTRTTLSGRTHPTGIGSGCTRQALSRGTVLW